LTTKPLICIDRELEQLNHAKGRLTTIIERSLDEIIVALALADCTCALYNQRGYLCELIRLKVFPFRDTLRRGRSVNDILRELENFSFTPQPGSCEGCLYPGDLNPHRELRRYDTYDRVVEHARYITKENFNGLCLDCMDRKRPKMKDEDWDYWLKDMREGGTWDTGCRISHGESTWHHSYHARREKETQQTTGV